MKKLQVGINSLTAAFRSELQVWDFYYVSDVVVFFSFLYGFLPSSVASVSSVSLSVRGAWQLPPPRGQPPHAHVQQWRGAFAVRHPSESPGVSQSPGPGQNNNHTAHRFLWLFFYCCCCCCFIPSLELLVCVIVGGQLGRWWWGIQWRDPQ